MADTSQDWDARCRAEVEDQQITVRRPHVPFGPVGVPVDKADADYLRTAAARIRESRMFGSNLTNTVAQLIEDAVDAILHADRDDEGGSCGA